MLGNASIKNTIRIAKIKVDKATIAALNPLLGVDAISGTSAALITNF
jgi:hypothetical protein